MRVSFNLFANGLSPFALWLFIVACDDPLAELGPLPFARSMNPICSMSTALKYLKLRIRCDFFFVKTKRNFWRNFGRVLTILWLPCRATERAAHYGTCARWWFVSDRPPWWFPGRRPNCDDIEWIPLVRWTLCSVCLLSPSRCWARFHSGGSFCATTDKQRDSIKNNKNGATSEPKRSAESFPTRSSVCEPHVFNKQEREIAELIRFLGHSAAVCDIYNY